MKAAVLTLVLMIATGCATPGSDVRCDGRLEPINMPASKMMEESSSASSTANLEEAEGES